jgi:hypothetical protein
MPERFKPNPFEAAAERDREEERKFWDDEIKGWQERQSDKTRKTRMSDEEIRRDIYNNTHGWLPAKTKGSFVGTKRDPDSLASYQSSDDPKQIEEAERLINDVDAYIEQNGLQDFVRVYATQSAGKAEAIMKAFESGKVTKEETWEKTITEGEIQEMMEDLYRAMRKKGYSRALLAS